MLDSRSNDDYSVVKKFDVNFDTVFCSSRPGDRTDARSRAATATNHTPEIAVPNANIKTGAIT
jgi:hypothetical protein